MDRSRFHLASARLDLRDAAARDIDRIQEIFWGNPEFLMLRDDLAADGDYDPGSVAGYCESAMIDPVRHLLVMVDRATDSVVGLVDFVEESPADGLPWIGLVIVDHSAQRQGLGSEALTTVIAGFGSAGHPNVHMAVMEANAPCLAFAASIGFTACDTATVATSRGTQSVILMELPLRRAERTAEGA